MTSMAIWSGADTGVLLDGSSDERVVADCRGLFFGRCRVRLGLEYLAAAVVSISRNAMT